jgi:hypothetical protein
MIDHDKTVGELLAISMKSASLNQAAAGEKVKALLGVSVWLYNGLAAQGLGSACSG